MTVTQIVRYEGIRLCINFKRQFCGKCCRSLGGLGRNAWLLPVELAVKLTTIVDEIFGRADGGLEVWSELVQVISRVGLTK